MKIKRIEICGFKSFVDKTTISFPDPITSIVGPNGCGKSNIVDAIRWVMEEPGVSRLVSVSLGGGPSRIGKARVVTESKRESGASA